MLTRIKKWGNSLAIRIPAAFSKDIGFEDGCEVELKVESGKLMIEPVRRKKLEQLLKLVTPDNIHAEVEWGKTVGKEHW